MTCNAHKSTVTQLPRRRLFDCRSVKTALAALISAPIACSASAQTPAEFYQGKTVTLIIGSGEGGGYDLIGRVIAGGLQRHIPSAPKVIVSNMPGASSVRATQYLYNVAARDGTVIGLVQATVVLQKLIDQKAHYNPQEFNWLGRFAPVTLAGVAWHTAPADSIEKAKTQEVIMGAAGATGYAAIIPWAINAIVGTKFRVVLGYKSMASEIVAMERGEIQAIGSLSWDYFPSQRPEWIAKKIVRPLFIIGPERYSGLPDTPTIIELADNDLDRNVMRMFASTISIGYATFTPPGVPADRLAALRAAFAKLGDDAEVRASAGKLKLELSPRSGPDLDKTVSDIFSMPPAVIEKMRAVIKPPAK
jgi:tripartite-type tricarboxylate transporter receptor subunit TctC